MEKTPRTGKEEEGEEVTKPDDKPKQDTFKEFVRKIVSVPKEELNQQEKQYQDERKKRRKK
jgi:hypothetical protein